MKKFTQIFKSIETIKGGRKIMKMIKTEEVLPHLAHELDDLFTGVSMKIETLNDLRQELAGIRIEMDNLDEANIRFYFNKLHRNIRLMDDLTFHTMKSLNDEFEEAEDIKNMIFAKVMKERSE